MSHQVMSVSNIASTYTLGKETFKNLIKQHPNMFGTDKLTKSLIEHTSIYYPFIFENINLSIFYKEPTNQQIMSCVDLTILDLNAKESEVIEVATRAANEHCATVCVFPKHIHIVNKVMQELNVNDVPPIAVVGFPFVPNCSKETTEKTVAETLQAISLGAKEIDMVLPFSFRGKNPDYQGHFNYIKSVVNAAHSKNVPVKVILETAYLTDLEICMASMLAFISHADWVKTSTGFAVPEKFAEGRTIDEKGATQKAVALMRLSVGFNTFDLHGKLKLMGVKASGGVKTKEQALAMISAGADRIGASNGINLISTPSLKSKNGY